MKTWSKAWSTGTFHKRNTDASSLKRVGVFVVVTDFVLEFDLNEFCDKRFKADYLTYQIKFADQLKYLSIKLKTLPLNDRTTFLKKKLEELNSWIADQVRSQLDTIPT